jgi:hypothetical protein
VAEDDTSHRAAALYRRLLLAKSGEQRIAMACSMFDAARAMVLAGIQAAEPMLSAAQQRIRLVERTYGGDLTPAQLARILNCLRLRDDLDRHGGGG